MSKYLTRYKGIYRIKPNLDVNTYDFPRNELCNIDKSFDDIYIKCAYGCQIYHYGGSVLVGYIPSIGRGRNILREIAKELNLVKNEDEELYNVKILYSLLEKDKTIFDIMENDSEIEFKFKSNKIDLIAKHMKVSTYGANISPFSSKNIPKNEYRINEEDISRYKCIVGRLKGENMLIVSRLIKEYLRELEIKEKFYYKNKSLKSHMKELRMNAKSYIHYTGHWDDFLNYLEKNI